MGDKQKWDLIQQLIANNDVIGFQKILNEWQNSDFFYQACQIEDSVKENILHYVVRKNKPAILELLIQNKKSRALLTQMNDEGDIPLHIACYEGNSASIKLLMEADLEGETINRFNLRGLNPLHEILLSANFTEDTKQQSVKLLVDHPKIDINARIKPPQRLFGIIDGAEAIKINASVYECIPSDDDGFLEDLIIKHKDYISKSHNDTDEEDTSDGSISIDSDDSEYDSEKDSDDNSFYFSEDENDEASWDELYDAVYFGLEKQVKELLQAEGFNLNKQYENGYTLLHIAAEANNYVILELLIKQESNIDPNIPDNFGRKPIHLADHRGAQLIMHHDKCDNNSTCEEIDELQLEAEPYLNQKQVLKKNLHYRMLNGMLPEDEEDSDYDDCSIVKFKRKNKYLNHYNLAGKTAAEIALETGYALKYFAICGAEVKQANYKQGPYVFKININRRHLLDFYPQGEKDRKAQQRRDVAEKKYLAGLNSKEIDSFADNLKSACTQKNKPGRAVDIKNRSARFLVSALVTMNTKILNYKVPSKQKNHIQRAFANYQQLILNLGETNIVIDLNPEIGHIGNGRIIGAGAYGLEKHDNILTFLNTVTSTDKTKETILAELFLQFSDKTFEFTPELLKNKGFKLPDEEFKARNQAQRLTRVAFLFCIFEPARRKNPGQGEVEYHFFTDQRKALKSVIQGKMELSHIFKGDSPYTAFTYTGVKSQVNKVRGIQNNLNRTYMQNQIEELLPFLKDLIKQYPKGQFICTQTGYRHLALKSNNENTTDISTHDSSDYAELQQHTMEFFIPSSKKRRRTMDKSEEEHPSKRRKTNQGEGMAIKAKKEMPLPVATIYRNANTVIIGKKTTAPSNIGNTKFSKKQESENYRPIDTNILSSIIDYKSSAAVQSFMFQKTRDISKGLFRGHKKDEEARKLLKANLSENFEAGSSLARGDCFFDSAAQSVSCIKKQQYTAKGLRLLCKDYVVALDKKPREENWIYQRFLANAAQHNQNKNQAKEVADTNYQDYMANIAYMQEDIDNGQGLNIKLAIWGEQDIDGPILRETLKVNLHVVEFHELSDQLILSHQVNGKSVDKASVDYAAQDTIHIAVFNSHFVPLLPKAAAIYADSIDDPSEHKENNQYLKPKNDEIPESLSKPMRF